MNSRKIHFIHPKDDSTDFLEEIYKYLSEKTNVEIKLLRLNNKNDHSDFFDIIPNIPENELILFLGHGTSLGLSGAITSEFQYLEFITDNQLFVFKNKQIILLACRSNQYLKTHFNKCDLKTAIGFPNLITDVDEIQYHDDQIRVEGLTAEDIELFKIIIVDVMKYSLEDYINNNLSIHQFYNRIKLRIHKRLIKLYNETPNKGKLPLGKMLNDMVEGMNFFFKL